MIIIVSGVTIGPGEINKREIAVVLEFVFGECEDDLVSYFSEKFEILILMSRNSRSSLVVRSYGYK